MQEQNKPWFLVRPDIKEEVIKDVSQYPGLRSCMEENHFVISGVWPVYEDIEEKKHLDSFLIKMVFPNDYPNSLPKIYEIGKRIKTKNPDTHFYNDSFACLFYPTERYIHFPKNEPFQFKKFLDGPVKSFFFSQLFYIYHKKWPFGERSHDLKGMLEFYSEKLEIPCNKKSVLKALSYLLKPKIRGDWPCPCGNKKLRECSHIEKLRLLHNHIPINFICSDLRLLMPKFPILHNRTNKNLIVLSSSGHKSKRPLF